MIADDLGPVVHQLEDLLTLLQRAVAALGAERGDAVVDNIEGR